MLPSSVFCRTAASETLAEWCWNMLPDFPPFSRSNNGCVEEAVANPLFGGNTEHRTTRILSRWRKPLLEVAVLFQSLSFSFLFLFLVPHYSLRSTRETVRQSLTDTFNCKYAAAGVLLFLIDHIIGWVSIFFFLLFVSHWKRAMETAKLEIKAPI